MHYTCCIHFTSLWFIITDLHLSWQLSLYVLVSVKICLLLHSFTLWLFGDIIAMKLCRKVVSWKPHFLHSIQHHWPESSFNPKSEQYFPTNWFLIPSETIFFIWEHHWTMTYVENAEKGWLPYFSQTKRCLRWSSAWSSNNGGYIYIIDGNGLKAGTLHTKLHVWLPDKRTGSTLCLTANSE